MVGEHFPNKSKDPCFVPLNALVADYAFQFLKNRADILRAAHPYCFNNERRRIVQETVV